MNATVVYAHPDPESFGRAVLDRVVRGLERSGHQVTVLDLYALDYPGAISPAEWQAYASGSPIIDQTVAHHAQLVQSTAALVFVYPTWWSSMPAIKKAWLERTLAAMTPKMSVGVITGDLATTRDAHSPTGTIRTASGRSAASVLRPVRPGGSTFDDPTKSATKGTSGR